MNKIFQSLMTASFFLLLFVGGVQATVLTFDEITTGDMTLIPNGYGGFAWESMGVIHEDYYAGSGYEYGVVSGEWAAFNAYDNMAVVTDSIFDFTGAWFTSAWDSSNTLTVKGYSGSTELYSANVSLNNLSPVWAQLDFIGIDGLTFNTTGTQFAMDDFTFNESSPVPEPSTMLLLSSGLLGFGLYRQRKKMA